MICERIGLVDVDFGPQPDLDRLQPVTGFGCSSPRGNWRVLPSAIAQKVPLVVQVCVSHLTASFWCSRNWRMLGSASTQRNGTPDSNVPGRSKIARCTARGNKDCSRSLLGYEDMYRRPLPGPACH